MQLTFRSIVWLAVALLAPALACVPIASEEPAPPSEIKIGSQRGYVVKAGLGQALVKGDLVLEGTDLAIGVRATGQIEEHGEIVVVRNGEEAHDWDALRALLAVDGVLYEPRVERVQLARVGKRPAIVVDAALETPNMHLLVQRTMRIADVSSAARLSTRVRVLSGALPGELRVVERVAFGGGYPSAPLQGQIRPEQPFEAEWLARAVQHNAVLLASRAGPVRVVGHTVDHGRTDLIRFSDVWLPTRATARDSYIAEAVLSASRHGLGQAVRALGWVRGKPFVEALVTLNTQPPDAQIEVLESKTGALVVSALPDEQRRAILPIPDAALSATLLARARAGGLEASAQRVLEGPPYRPLSLAITDSSVLVVSVTQAVTGEPLPARVRILPLRGTRALTLGADWSAAGAIDTLILAHGRATIRLPAGYYRVIATHGPEWSVFDQSIELGVAGRIALDAPLERAIDPGAWVPCELHVHQVPSPDSHVTLEDRVASLVAEGIAFAIPTDHNHVTDFGPAIRVQPLWGLASVPGVEVTTAEPILGHFNAYPYPLEPAALGQGAPEHRGLRPAELFSSLHALDPDLIVQVNHPRIEGGIGYFEVAEYDAVRDEGSDLWSHDFDALEVWNGYDLARSAKMERVLSEWLSMLEHGHRVVATGSSDSHTIRSEGAGYPRTYVRAPLGGVADERQLVRALRQGRAFVTSGPFLMTRIGEHGIGDSVALHGKQIELDVFVQIPHWMQLSTLRVYAGSTLLRSLPIGSPSATTSAARRYRRTLRLTVERPAPLVVVVEGPATLDPIVARRGVRPFAFTNPIWLVSPEQAVTIDPPIPFAAAAALLEDAGSELDAGAFNELPHHVH